MSAADTTVIVLHNPPQRRRWSKDEPPQMRIVLLGSSVSENSLVGNFMLGRAAFDSDAPPDVVERVGGRLKDRHVIIINSPQLLQTNISDHQITQTVRECVFLSDPGPYVIVLLLKHDQYSAEDQEHVEKVLRSFSESVYQHTMVLSTQEPTETSDILQKIIQKCANRHFSLQSSSSPDDLLQTLEHIEKINDGRYLDCAEASQCFMMEQQTTERLSESVKLNLLVCGSDGALKSSVSEQILQQTDRRSDVEIHDRLINLLELPALIGLSEEEVVRQTLRCVSLCHPGVHVFLLIIPDAPLNNEDKAEIEEIQRIFSSRINKHLMILIKQSSEHQTEELSEETQSVIERFGGRHQFFGPKTQVSTLMENIEQMLEENRGDCFSTEKFVEVQMKKLMKREDMKKKINSLETHLHKMKREREKLEKQKKEEKMKREEEDEKRREKEQRDCDEFNQRLKQERERMKREKADLQSKHEEEENKKKILMDKLQEEKERKRGSGYLAVCFGLICVILLVLIILQHNRFASIINSRQGFLVKAVAEALKEAEAKLPYISKRARDWGYYIPVVGAAAGAVIGFVEDFVYAIGR